MKILLLGEYSGVHNNLRNALIDDGHDVLLISDGDSYKSFYSDIFIKYKLINTDKNLLIKLLYVLLSLSGFKGCIQIIKYIKVIKKMKGYDVVQLINPVFLSGFGSIVNLLVFSYIKNNNKKVFLSALGDDYYYVEYCLNGNFCYSPLDRLNLNTIKSYIHPLTYKYGFLYPYLNKYIVNKVNGIIPGLYDYYQVYQAQKNCTEIVPIIIPLQKKYKPSKTFNYPIRIFHGWQPGMELRKGNDIFDKAVKRAMKEYPNKIEYTVAGGLTYQNYVKLLDNSDIVLDQCYSLDQGVNALICMSKGKIVFSGFDPKVKEYFNISYNPLINSTPNVEDIYNKIINMVVNPTTMANYSTSSIKYIETYHSSRYVLNKYYKIWESY